MRIERVIGRNFQEASEITKRKFGIDCMVLSTNKVGGSTEMLVAVDSGSAADQISVVMSDAAAAKDATAKAATASFRSTVDFTPAAATAQPTPKAAATDPTASVEGSRMVEAIRTELVALERRLAQIGEAGDAVALKMSIVGLGVSASYANSVTGESASANTIAKRIADEICVGSVHDLDQQKQVLFVGPSGSGKTTVVMQAAATLVSAGDKQAAAVSSLRDTRIGSRERFFALADAAGLEAHWGSAQTEVRVIDSGGLELSRIQAGEAATENRDVVVCLPSYMNRATAQQWINATTQPAGVVISHWDPSMLPLGLLAMLAELKVPLLAVSTGEAPTTPLGSLTNDSIRIGLEHVMQLAVSQSQTKVA